MGLECIYVSKSGFGSGVSDPSSGFITIYSSAGFQLKNTARLSEFKDWLESSYDALGKAGVNRKWVIIDDAALYSTIDSLSRYISYMNLLYPIIFVLVIGIGFFVSNLLLKSRAGEITVLRSVGTRKGGVFLSFFWEQVVLSAVGILCGVGISWLVLGGLGDVQPLSLLAFAACYYTGAALAIVTTCRKVLIQSLAQKEE